MTIRQQVFSYDQRVELNENEYDQLLKLRVLVGALVGGLAVGLGSRVLFRMTSSHIEGMFGFFLFILGAAVVAISLGTAVGVMLVHRKLNKAGINMSMKEVRKMEVEYFNEG